MPSLPRGEVIDESVVGTYHIWGRVTQRDFLLGRDPKTGRNHRHRKKKLRLRIEALGSTIQAVEYVSLEDEAGEAALAEALRRVVEGGAALVVLAGETAIVDRHDIAPRALERAGGEVVCFGAPVDPEVKQICARSSALRGTGSDMGSDRGPTDSSSMYQRGVTLSSRRDCNPSHARVVSRTRAPVTARICSTCRGRESQLTTVNTAPAAAAP